MSNIKRFPKSRKMKNSASRNVVIAGFISLLMGAWAVAQTGGETYFYMGSPALSTSNLSVNGGMLFELRFDVETFEGDLIARDLKSDGTFDAGSIDFVDADGNVTVNAVWQGKNTTTAQSVRGASTIDNRIIITSDATGGRRFWADDTDGEELKLTNAMKDAISGTDPVAVVKWTRGWDVDEGTSDYRERSTVMGNPVHGSAVYLGEPNALYGNGYSTFSNDLAGRAPLVFIGAGDGMMHAFRADNGEEVFAYIPSVFLEDLKGLTTQTQETFLVDGTPAVGDGYGAFPQCYTSPCWRTMLVSGLGLGAGGNTVFALDVTNPVVDIVDEVGAAEKLFLWEFTDDDLAGNTISEPIIGQLDSGVWAAIFGSGQATKSVLYVVDLATGGLIQKLAFNESDTTAGLSSPSVRIGADHKIDALYAGDSSGNLWKFVPTSTGSPPFEIAFSGNPLVTVTDPPSEGGSPLQIRTRPVVASNPNDVGVIVYFGTGNVNDLTVANGMFGVFDKGTSLGTNPSLDVHVLEPIRSDGTIVTDQATIAEALNPIFRIITEATLGINSEGWKVQLLDGERVLTNPRLNNGRINFTTSDSATTNFNRNWFMGVNYVTGGEPGAPFLDTNGDQLFDENDIFEDVFEDCPVTEDEFGLPLPPDPDCLINAFSAIPVGRFLDTGVVSGPVPANIAPKKDTVFITHGLETVFNLDTIPEQQFLVDPGVSFGHFDHDTHQAEFDVAQSKRDHTHEYDDRYNVNGVNMLVGGGNYIGTSDDAPNTFDCASDPSVCNPILSPIVDTEGAQLHVTGMMSADKALMDSLLELEVENPEELVITLSIENPYSWDTQALADHREEVWNSLVAIGQREGPCPEELCSVAPDVLVWYECLALPRPPDYRGRDPSGDPEKNGLRKVGDPAIVNSYMGSAPGFGVRTCPAENIGVLVSKIPNVNALRIRDAGRDECYYNLDDIEDARILDEGADSLGEDQYWLKRFYPDGEDAYLNSGYRGGSFTVRARADIGDGSGLQTFHEDAIYEHVNGGTIVRGDDPDTEDVEEVGASDDEETRALLDQPKLGIGGCTDFSEWQRAYKDPDLFDPGEANVIEDNSEVSTVNTTGTQITETIDVLQIQVSEGRKSWREMLK